VKPRKSSAAPQAMIDKFGVETIDQHYRMFDTICGATQERQDALIKLLAEPLDIMIVVGGYNSSNTTHLAEMSEEKVPCYFIRNRSKILSENAILHFDLHKQEEVLTENWLPAGDVTSASPPAHHAPKQSLMTRCDDCSSCAA